VLDFSQPILLGGTFTYDGGTGIFADAVGSAFADGGVALSETTAPSTASLSLNGSLTY
jgi:glycerate kinase